MRSVGAPVEGGVGTCERGVTAVFGGIARACAGEIFYVVFLLVVFFKALRGNLNHVYYRGKYLR